MPQNDNKNAIVGHNNDQRVVGAENYYGAALSTNSLRRTDWS